MSVTGLLRWTGGSQSGPGTTTVQPGARIEADAQFSCSVNLTDGRMLDNRGTISILGGTVIFAFGSDRPVIDNRGRLELTGSASGGCANSHGISGDGLVNNIDRGDDREARRQRSGNDRRTSWTTTVRSS